MGNFPWNCQIFGKSEAHAREFPSQTAFCLGSKKYCFQKVNQLSKENCLCFEKVVYVLKKAERSCQKATESAHADHPKILGNSYFYAFFTKIFQQSGSKFFSPRKIARKLRKSWKKLPKIISKFSEIRRASEFGWKSVKKVKFTSENGFWNFSVQKREKIQK